MIRGSIGTVVAPYVRAQGHGQLLRKLALHEGLVAEVSQQNLQRTKRDWYSPSTGEVHGGTGVRGALEDAM